MVLGELVAIGGNWWLSVGCDGQPFDLCRKLIDREMVCGICGDHTDTDNTEQHHLQQHPDDEINFHKLYDRLLLRPGHGHVEMNCCKVLFRLLWTPVLQVVTKILGFASDAAQTFIRNCGNHHVTWQIVRVTLESVSKELAVSYVRYCLTTNEEITADGILEWISTAQNNNYVLISKLCDLLLAVSVMRAGVRRNNSQAMLAGRQKVAPLFFIGPHHTYQRLIVRDMVQRAQLPPKLKQYVDDRTAFSVSGDPTRGEGGDFVLEGKNRQTKSWLPPGKALQRTLHEDLLSPKVSKLSNH